jgi:hypothetical protein
MTGRAFLELGLAGCNILRRRNLSRCRKYDGRNQKLFRHCKAPFLISGSNIIDA